MRHNMQSSPQALATYSEGSPSGTWHPVEALRELPGIVPEANLQKVL